MLIRSDLLDSVLASIRRWREAKLQFAVLLLTISVLSALVSVLVQINTVTSRDRPEFVGTSSRLISLVRTDMSNVVKPVKGVQIEKLGHLEGVVQTAAIGVQQSDVKLDDHIVGEFSIGFVEPELVELLALPAVLSGLVSNPEQVYVTSSFWDRCCQAQSLTSMPQITLLETGKRYFIAGVLPANMERWSSTEIGIYSDISQLAHFAPFRLTQAEKADPEVLAHNQKYTRNYLRGAPQYFGFALLEEQADLTALYNSFMMSDYDVGDAVEFIEEEHRIKLVNGVEVDPISRGQIVTQWRGVLFLATLLLVAIVSNLIYTQISQLLSRKKELVVKRSLGASQSALVKECFIELLPILAISQLLSYVCYHFTLQRLQDSVLFTQYLGAETLDVNMGIFALVGIGVGVVLSLVFSLPYVTAFRKIKAISAKTNTLTKSQLRVLEGNVLVQTCMIVLAVFLVLLVVSEVQSRSDKQTFNLARAEFRLSSEFPFPMGREVKQGQIGRFDDNQVAVYFDSFVNPIALTDSLILNDRNKQSELSVERLHVSPNYFAQFNIRFSLGSTFNSDEDLVINRYLAKRIAAYENTEDENELIGRSITLRGFFKTYVGRVSGIVENVPHFGFSHTDRPIIYRPLSSLPKLFERGFYASVDVARANEFEAELREWADLHAGTYTLERQASVAKQLYQFEYVQNETYKVALVIAASLLLLLVFNIYHIAKTNLRLNKQKLAIVLSLGAGKNSQVLTSGQKQLWHFLWCLPLVTAMIAVLRPYLATSLFIDVVNIAVFVISVAVALNIVLAIHSLVTYRYMRQPISRMF